jgi:heme-degrading monooxygenase HmoA
MFARMSVYEVPEAGREEADAQFREALAQIGGAEGFVEGYYLFASESDKAVTLVVWETYEAMIASRVSASRIRSDAARAAGGEVVSVEEFSLVAHNRAGASELSAER